ncbi:MAG: N-acetylmuramoyl-L-alanine amidase [Flavobacteriaceae bacterium]|nr:N-acetylmuramoyl-L-alanine amidase [Flavobacteriaceae bacterium]
MKIALCIGHNSIAQGAKSPFLGTTEYLFNNRVAILVQQKLEGVEIFTRKWQNSYVKEITELSNRVNQKSFDLAFELHFNSSMTGANGVEALYFHKSTKGKSLAESFCETIEMEYSSKNRGAKPLSGTNQNGFGFVQKMKAPAIILEPFFGSHKEALDYINVERYANAIVKWLQCSI